MLSIFLIIIGLVGVVNHKHSVFILEVKYMLILTLYGAQYYGVCAILVFGCGRH